MSEYTIASVSCGKDSLVIPYEYIRRGLRLDEVIMYDTGMEFQAIYDEWAALAKLLDENGIKHTVLKPAYDFCWQMFDRPVNQGKENEHLGYSWCGGTCRWGTADKRTALGKYAEERGAIVLVGIAADEAHRKEKEYKPYKRFPLIDWGMSEADCLAYPFCFRLIVNNPFISQFRSVSIEIPRKSEVSFRFKKTGVSGLSPARIC